MGTREKPAMLVMAMVIVAIVFGGNALTAPLAELTAECLIALLALLWFGLDRAGGLRDLPPRAVLVAALVVALPLMQLIPLPATIWQRLPGRELEIDALALIGQEHSWRPLSLTPARTLAGLLGTGCSIAMLLATVSLDCRGRDRVLVAIAAGAGLTLLVGAAQVSGGDGNLFRFYQPHQETLAGFQSSHNMAAEVLLTGLAAFGALVANHMESSVARGSRLRVSERSGQDAAPNVRKPMIGPLTLLLAGNFLLILGVILTGSRTGIALIVVPLVAQLVMFRRRLAITRRIAFIGAATLLLAAAVLGLLLQNNTALGRTFARFGLRTDLRPQIWIDAIVAAQQYFPWGSGLGSFMPIFMPVERLEAVRPFYAGAADCDYLQLAIEAGVPGFVVLAAIVTVLAGAAIRRMRSNSPRVVNQTICAVSILSTIGIHSLLEFPLRTIALAGMAGIAGAMLLSRPDRPSPQELCSTGTVKERP